MPQDASCPTCKAAFPVTESRTAFTVACPKCDAEMTVEFKKPAAAPEAGQPHYDLLVKPGALVGAVPPPPAKKKARDDEDDDEPKRKGGSAAIVLLSGGAGLLFVLGGLGLTAWVLFDYVGRETAANTTNNNNNRPNNTPNNNNRPNNNNPRPNPGPDPFNPGPIVPPKPKDTFELKPVGGTVPQIVAPSLTSAVSNIDLGTKVGAVAVGGGGRYLVMHFPDKGQLGVFDANTGQVTTGPADTGDVLLTAGLSRVVTCVPNSNTFRVYSLPDLAKQFDNPAPGGVRGMAMGSRTNGPLLTVLTFGEVRLWEVGDAMMKDVEGASVKPQPDIHWHERGLRAAPDGTAFSTHDGFANHQKTTLLTVANRKWKVQPDIGAVPFPSVDGHFFGNGTVVSKTGQDMKYGGIGANSGTWFLPSVSSKDYFLKLAPFTIGSGGQAKKTLSVSVHKGRNPDVPAAGTTALAGLPEFENMVDRWGEPPAPAVPYDRHFFLIPEAKLLVVLNGDRNRLVLRRLDIK